MAKIDKLLPGQADIDDWADSIFLDHDQEPVSKWEWGTSFTETIDITANIDQWIVAFAPQLYYKRPPD